jgi:nucleoside-triphosphatase THEP1
MYTAYHLNMDELNAEVIQRLKNIFYHREVVIVPKDEYDEMEKARHNAAYTEELQRRIVDLEEGNGIVKTMAELEAMENG